MTNYSLAKELSPSLATWLGAAEYHDNIYQISQARSYGHDRYLSAKLSACDAVRGNIFNINCFPLMAQQQAHE